jgi:hypothetical protein
MAPQAVNFTSKFMQLKKIVENLFSKNEVQVTKYQNRSTFQTKFILNDQNYTVILFSAKVAEIRLNMVEYAQFKIDHHFWSNFVQFGWTHGWFSTNVGVWSNLNCVYSTVFEPISTILAENKITLQDLLLLFNFVVKLWLLLFHFYPAYG